MRRGTVVVAFKQNRFRVFQKNCVDFVKPELIESKAYVFRELWYRAEVDRYAKCLGEVA